MKPKSACLILFSTTIVYAVMLVSCGQNLPVTPQPFLLLNQPRDIVSNKAGTCFVSDIGNFYILSVNSAGVVQPLANVTMNEGCSGDGGICYYAKLTSPQGLAVDSSGNVYFGDDGCYTIHRIDATTHTMTLIAGNGSNAYSGDGGPAVSAGLGSPQLSGPGGIVLDNKGNLFVADGNRIRKVVLNTGIITTMAGNGNAGYSGDGGLAVSAQLQNPSFIAADDSGNIYISDVGNCRIRKVTAATNVITTIAGNGKQGYNGDSISATSAELNNPAGIKVDASGNVYICDAPRVRFIKANTNVIYTVAGNGQSGYSGDGSPATSAELNNPFGLTFDYSGDFLILDAGNNNVRRVNISTGIISTVLHD